MDHQNDIFKVLAFLGLCALVVVIIVNFGGQSGQVGRVLNTNKTSKPTVRTCDYNTNSDECESVVSETNTGSNSSISIFPVAKKLSKVLLFGGGGQDSGYTSIWFNDVWLSDTVLNTWNLLLADTASPGPNQWQRRELFGSAYYHNNVWLVAGQRPFLYNDVWNTPDGVGWRLINSNAPFGGGQNSYTYSTPNPLAVFQDKLWLVGGNGLPSHFGVWYSTDGVTWTQTASTITNCLANRVIGYSLLVFHNKLWLLGGTGGFNINAIDVCSSIDGYTWTQETSTAPWGDRDGQGALVFGGKMWILGGHEINTGIEKNDSWYSSDGILWTQAATSSGWSPRENFSIAVANGRMWIFGGALGLNDIWSSTDGIIWTEVTSNAPWPARTSFGVVRVPESF